MNKCLIVLGIAVLLLAIGLCGCNEEQIVDESNFIGSWSSVDISAVHIENESEVNITMTFFINNTVLTVTTYPDDVIETLSEYKVEKDKLIFIPIGEPHNFSESWDYEFSHGENRLTLKYQGKLYIIYERIL